VFSSFWQSQKDVIDEMLAAAAPVSRFCSIIKTTKKTQEQYMHRHYGNYRQ
jgi:hypothetical protein